MAIDLTGIVYRVEAFCRGKTLRIGADWVAAQLPDGTWDLESIGRDEADMLVEIWMDGRDAGRREVLDGQ